MIKLTVVTLLVTMNVLKITNMKFIPYTSEDNYRDWVKYGKKRKRKRKQYSSKIHKNLNSR